MSPDFAMIGFVAALVAVAVAVDYLFPVPGRHRRPLRNRPPGRHVEGSAETEAARIAAMGPDEIERALLDSYFGGAPHLAVSTPGAMGSRFYDLRHLALLSNGDSFTVGGDPGPGAEVSGTGYVRQPIDPDGHLIGEPGSIADRAAQRRAEAAGSVTFHKTPPSEGFDLTPYLKGPTNGK